MKRVGWVERVSLFFDDPVGDVAAVKLPAKMDTGAKGCALHAKHVRVLRRGRRRRVEFCIVGCRAPVTAPFRVTKRVRSSNGESNRRPTVHGIIVLGGRPVPATLSLADRSEMGYPLLLGRDFLEKRYLVDCARKFVLSTRRPRQPKPRRDTKLSKHPSR